MPNLKPLSAHLKVLLYLLKLILSGVILWLVFRKVEISHVISGIASIPLSISIIVLSISVIRHYLQYRNWWLALRMNPWFKAERSQIARSYLIGNLLRFLLPGGHGSFGKVFFIENSSKTASAAAVASEKLAQSWAVLLFSALAALYLFFWWNLILRFALIFLVIALPFIATLIVDRHPSLKIIREGFRRDSFPMLGIQIVTTLLTMLQYWLLLNTQAAISFISTMWNMALVNFSDLIPITISGLGLRESFAIHILEDAGFDGHMAITATLALFFFQDIIPALLGAVIMLSTKTKRNQ